MQVKRVAVYRYEELDKKAQEKARQRYVEDATSDDFWWRMEMEDLETLFGFLGFSFKQQEDKNGKGVVVSKHPKIWFNLYYQTCSFDGWYRHEEVNIDGLKQYAPLELGLLEMARKLKLDGKENAAIHSIRDGRLDFEFEPVEEEEYDEDREKPNEIILRQQELVKDAAKMVRRHILATIQKAYDHAISEDCMTEEFDSNNTLFFADGRAFPAYFEVKEEEKTNG